MAPMARNRIVAQAAIRFRSYPDQAGRCGGTRLRAAAAIFDAIREVVRLVDEADPAFAAVFHREDRRRHVVGLRNDDPADVVQVVYPDGRELLAELAVPLLFQGPDGEVRADEALAFAARQRGPIRLQATGPVHCFGLHLAAASIRGTA